MVTLEYRGFVKQELLLATYFGMSKCGFYNYTKKRKFTGGKIECHGELNETGQLNCTKAIDGHNFTLNYQAN